MSKFKTAKVSLLLVAVVVLARPGCGEILGPSFPVIASPRFTPAEIFLDNRRDSWYICFGQVYFN